MKKYHEGIDGIIGKIRSQFEDYNNTLVKIAILGRTGTGKSTFINTLAGMKISPTSGLGECTGVNSAGHVDSEFTPVEFKTGGLCFHDLPGYGTDNFPQATFMKDFKIKKNYDCVILMTNLRLEATDKAIYQQIKEAGIPCFVVWTKFDETLRNAANDGVPTDSVVLSKMIYVKLSKDLNDGGVHVFVISNEPHLYDFPRLKEEIEESLSSEAKKQRFVESVAAQTEKDLQKKKEVATKLVAWMSALAAGVSAVPDPTIIAGATVDIALLVKMAQRIVHIYGLEKDQLDFHGSIISIQIKTEITKYILGLASTEAAIQVLKRVAGRVTVKSVAKYIPFVGSIVAALIGYKITSNFGYELVEECEGLARNLLKDILHNSSVA